MKLEDQLVGLELCERLQELGVKQDSIWHWLNDPRRREPAIGLYPIREENQTTICSAFSVAELGEKLPLLCETVRTREDYWRIEYRTPATTKEGRPYWERVAFKASAEADARAKMLIYLLEQKLVTP